jgi:hypothetical protein
MNPLTVKIARAFVSELVDQLRSTDRRGRPTTDVRGAGEFDEIRHANRLYQDNPDTCYKDVCASHEFLDSNMAMEPAISAIVPDFSVDNEAHCLLWNEAWDIAKRNFLTAPHYDDHMKYERPSFTLYVAQSDDEDVQIGLFDTLTVALKSMEMYPADAKLGIFLQPAVDAEVQQLCVMARENYVCVRSAALDILSVCFVGFSAQSATTCSDADACRRLCFVPPRHLLTRRRQRVVLGGRHHVADRRRPALARQASAVRPQATAGRSCS